MMVNLDMDDQDWDGFSSDEHSSEESDVNCSMDREMESDLVSVSFKHSESGYGIFCWCLCWFAR